MLPMEYQLKMYDLILAGKFFPLYGRVFENLQEKICSYITLCR